jgi:spore coat protein H
MGRSGRWRWQIGAVLFLAAVLGLGTAGNAGPAKDSAAFFAAKEVLQIVLDIDKEDIESLRKEPHTYVKATLTENGKVVYKNVGVHTKASAGSVRSIDDKASLTVNMDKFGEEKTFHGMDKWHLSNSVQDATYLTELICGEMYRAEGLPASRIRHALVTVNGKMRGLYYLKEGYDRNFRKQNFEDPHGNLYDSGFVHDLDAPLQLLAGSADVEKHTDLAALMAAVAEKQPGERFKKLEKLLDMDKFITYLCLQVLTWDIDGYPLNLNNYRVYHEPKKDKIIIFPSGMDQMFTDPRAPLFPHVNGKLARAVLELPEGRERYLKRMAEILKKFDVGAVAKRLGELREQIQPALASVDEKAGRDYPNRVQRLSEAVQARVKSLAEQLAKATK